MGFLILDDTGEPCEDAFLSVLEQFQGIERANMRGEACEDDCEATQRDALETVRGEGFHVDQKWGTYAEQNPAAVILAQEAQIADRFFNSLTRKEYRQAAGLPALEFG